MSKFSLSLSLSLSLLMLMSGFIVPICLKAQRSFIQVNTYSSPDAHQAVAVDSSHFYAIATRSISKYDKATGRQVSRWMGKAGGAILHLDSGVIIDGKLYAAHSNYPELPMTSSVEMWDTETMEHTGSYSFGIRWGSCTWLDRHDGYWWGVFAHYEEFSDELGKDNRWTTLIQFNDQWEPLEAWVLPEKVLDRFDGKSNSGGSWGPDGLLYLSGHDRSELYAMQLPEKGSVLELVEIIPVTSEGQGIAWDPSRSEILYTISRSKRQVNVLKFTGK